MHPKLQEAKAALKEIENAPIKGPQHRATIALVELLEELMAEKPAGNPATA